MAKDLEYYLAQARRIAEHREAGAEKEIRKLYKEMLKDLQSFMADAYVKYAQGDKLTFAMLQEAGYNARFLEEIERRINVATPKAAKELRQLVNDTYKLAYEGMVEGVKKAAPDGLDTAFAGSIAISPQQIKAAVENPVYGLTLKDTLEKNRKEIIYSIKQTVGVGLMNGDRYTTMARRIAEQVDGDYKKAIRIARTEAHRVREAGNMDATIEVDKALENGTSGMRMVKTWHTMKDERVRPQRRRRGKKGGWSSKMGKGANHMILDGQTVLSTEPFDLKDGNTAMQPGQSGIAGHDINCRCYASVEMMTDAEFYAKTGKHFPDQGKPKEKPLPEITDAIDFGYGNYTDEDYNKWWDEYEAHNKHVKLSAKELEVIDNYTEGAFVGMNGVSRGDLELLKKKGYTDEDIQKALKNADILEDAIRKFDLDTNIVTHRFERDVSWLTGSDNSVEALESMIGKEYTAKGFTSSGMLPNRFRFTGGKPDAVHFEIVTPKGTDGAFLYMSKKGENEFLYNRSTRFQIIDGGERIIKEQELDIKTMKMVEVDVKERFLKVQVVLDDVAEEAVEKAVESKAAKKAAEKLAAENFPSAFTKGTEKRNTQKFVEYINGLEGANADTIRLYNSMGKLESIESNGIPFKISHGKNHAVQETMRYNGDLVETKLIIPKLSGENLAGQVGTMLHEEMHLMDMYCRTDKKKAQGWFSASRKSLTDAFKNTSQDMSDEVSDLFKQFDKEYKATKDALSKEYREKREALRESYFPNGASIWSDIPKYRQYEKEAKKLDKWLEEEHDYRCRNIMGGGVNALQDVYDALSGGAFRDNGTVKYGHGSKYYRNNDNRVMETLANYGVLSVQRPDLLDMLRADKPDLVAELEATVKEMLKKAGE